MPDLKLIVCDNCFVVRKEFLERKCPICETGTLKINNTISELAKIDQHELQDLLKKIKQPEGLSNLIEDACNRYGPRDYDTFHHLFKYLVLNRYERRSLGANFWTIVDELLSNTISRKQANLWNAGNKISLGDINSLISFQHELKNFQRESWGKNLLAALIEKYNLINNHYLIRCKNCSKLYMYAGQNTCILCDSNDIDDFEKKLCVYTHSDEEFNLEELLAQLMCWSEEHDYEKFVILLSAFFNTHISGYATHAAATEQELTRSLARFQSGISTLAELLSEVYEIKAGIYRKSGHDVPKPHSSKFSKEDSTGRKGPSLHDGSFDKFNPSYNDISKRSPVLASVFSPQEVNIPAGFLVQVFIYNESHTATLETIAKSADQDTTKRTALTLIDDLPAGQKLEVTLIAPQLSIDEPVQTCVWDGNLNTLQFIVDVAEDYPKKDIICTVIISMDAIPLGHMKFKIKFTRHDKETKEFNNPQNVTHLSKYRRVFISYASEDRTEVLKRIQMLQASKIDYFNDILSLEPGEKWENSLYRNIAISDAFFLFWSSAAKKSKWVKKELIYALNVKNGGEDNLPEIIPIIIEGPPVPKPPKELNFLHFNDKLLYLMTDGK